MITSSAPLQAYAEDVGRFPGREALGSDDAAWVSFAHAICRLRDMAPDREWLDGVSTGEPVAGIALLAARADWAALAALVLTEAERMENAGGLTLARTTLTAMRELLPEDASLECGRLLAQEARVTRYLGDVEAAATLYEQVARIGRRAKLDELRVRADLGFAILARIRGDYPAARERMARAASRAKRANLPELLASAQQMLLIAAAMAGDYAAALVHGWGALELVRGRPKLEATVLINLGSVCSSLGQERAALATYLRASELTEVDLMRLAALASAALSAARLGDRSTAMWCVNRVERLLVIDAEPYERGQVDLVLAEALWELGNRAGAEEVRARGEALSDTHGYHELRLEFDALREKMGAAHREEPRAVSIRGRARGVIRSLEHLQPTLAQVATVSSRD